MSAYDIQEEAYAAFDAWISAQSIDVQEMDLLDQIDAYAAAWSLEIPEGK